MIIYLLYFEEISNNNISNFSKQFFYFFQSLNDRYIFLQCFFHFIIFNFIIIIMLFH